MKVLVTGGRDFQDYARLSRALSEIHAETPIQRIVHGAARGADSLADRWAKETGIEVSAYPADWENDGRAAGPIRNARMLREEKPDLVVACPGGRGTAHMKGIAERAKTPVREIA